MNEKSVQSFWEGHPCGEELVGGLDNFGEDYLKFFDEYDAFRYNEYPELLKVLDHIGFDGKSVLEIGLGEGADSEQIIRRGAVWSGVDLTFESISRVKARMKLKKLRFSELKQGSALDLPFKEGSFDKVYSCGVLHHIPEIKKAQQEIHRVLRKDGELVMMLYAKVSLNYLLSIFVLRRVVLACLYIIGAKGNPGSKTSQHLKNAREVGLFKYLKMSNFIHRNTDGPLNPYAKVYDMNDVKSDFPDFEVSKVYKNFMHAPPIPVHGMPGGSSLGWCLWVHMKPKKT